jgi:hypothetical protein
MSLYGLRHSYALTQPIQPPITEAVTGYTSQPFQPMEMIPVVNLEAFPGRHSRLLHHRHQPAINIDVKQKGKLRLPFFFYI